MFTSTLREWVRAQPAALRHSLVETWNTAGVRTGEVCGQPIVRLGRAAAILRANGRVETTAFMRQSPLVLSLEAGVAEASWSSSGGAVFNASSATGDPSPLDSAGMYASAGGWTDIITTLRLRLLAREREEGTLPWLENAPSRSADYSHETLRSRRIEPGLERELIALLSEEFTVAAEAATAWWRDNLPRRLLDIMEQAAWNSPDRWNWLLADMRKPQPRRIQALEAFPWSSSLLRLSAPLLKVVDDGEPLVQALLANLTSSPDAPDGITPALVRRMRGMPRIPRIALVDIMKVLAAPDAVIPTTPDGWWCWVAAFTAARRAGQQQMGGAGWDTLDLNRFRRAMEALPDACQDLCATLLHPLAALTADTPPVADMLRVCLLSSPQSSMERVELWMSDGGAARRTLMNDWPVVAEQAVRVMQWPALHEKWDSGYGLHAVVLASETALEAESVEMSHCVRGYGNRCFVSGCHIISWRTSDGRSVATQEIQQVDILALAGTRTEPFVPSRNLPPGTVQLNGWENEQPPDKVFMAAWAHAGAIAMGTLPLDCDGLSRSLEHRQRLGGAWNCMTEWDYRAPGALRAALRLYKPLLPKRLRESMERCVRTFEADMTPDAPDVHGPELA